ncbi:hypothetical protein D3C80_1898240 [compost metagenome]
MSENDHKNVGDLIGTFDQERIDDRPSDLKDESKNYFSGMTLDNILLNSIQPDDDQVLTATFISMGGIFTVYEGDYLADIYYVKKINRKEQKVILEYNGSEHELTTQLIISPEKLNK